MALDFGKKRIGVAISDAAGRIAFPLATIHVAGPPGGALEEVRRYVEREQVALVIVGLPLAMDGTRGKAAEHCERFAASLARTVSVPVKTWDERFSTRQAERSLLEADVRRERRKEIIDQVAASLILQTFLDTQGSPSEGPDE